MRAFLCAALLILISTQAAFAITSPRERLDDPVLAARAEIIAKDIRCVVCQNQSIADSDSEIALGLRTLIAVQLKEGKSNDEIITYIHDRYGDFILMKPPVKPATWALWFGPALIFLLGLFAASRMMKRKPSAKTTGGHA